RPPHSVYALALHDALPILAIEDHVLQGMPDVSPPKWHLAHVTWFFETFLLLPYLPGYRCVDARYDHLFNSYYVTHSQPFPRAERDRKSTRLNSSHVKISYA